MNILARARPRFADETPDESPAHELAVERFAASHPGALGPQTLHAIQIHAAREAGRRGRPSDGAALAVAWLNELAGVSGDEMAALMGKSESWGREAIKVGRRIAGEPPRAPGRKRAAG